MIGLVTSISASPLTAVALLMSVIGGLNSLEVSRNTNEAKRHSTIAHGC